MEDFDSKMNKHISKVLELQRNKESRPLSLDELKELDLSMGMTEDEWNELMKKAEELAEVAQSHLAYKNFAEAYKQAENAASINPYHEKALLILAQAAVGKYEADDKDEFLDKAKTHADELLKFSKNNQKAIQVLAQIRKYERKERSQKKKIIRWVAIISVIAIIILAYFKFRPDPKVKTENAIKFELIEKQEAANAAWAQVENVISRRDKMLPELLSLVKDENTESITIKEEIQALQSNLKSAANQAEKIKLQAELQEKIKALIGKINEGETDNKVETVLIQIEGSYNRISVEGKRYNEVTKQYNVLARKHEEKYPEFKPLPYFKGN